MIGIAKNGAVKIEEPATKVYIGGLGDTLRASFYVFTDGLGCTHLAQSLYSDSGVVKWYRVDANLIADEMARCAKIYAGDIEEQRAAGSSLCIYEFMYLRLNGYMTVHQAIAKAFPAIEGRRVAGEVANQ